MLTGDVPSNIKDRCEALGVVITTWGRIGVFVDEKGDPTYPAISWQDPRTRVRVMYKLKDFSLFH